MNKSRANTSIKQKQAVQLLKLQQLFHSHYMTEELLNEMISLYVKFSENISQTKHPMRFYFMEKIRYVLSRPEIIKILDKEVVNQNQNIRETLKVGTSNEEEAILLNKLTEQAKEEVRQNHIINLKKDRQYEPSALGQQLKNKERNMKIELQMKIMEQVQQNIKKIDKDFQKADKKRQQNDKYIHTMVNKQDQSLNERLAYRKRKLRKKSACLHEKELVQVIQQPPMPKHMLILVQQILNQNYERFTRMTAARTKMGTQKLKDRENEGKVKMKIDVNPIEEEQISYQISVKQSKQLKEKQYQIDIPIPSQGHNPEQIKGDPAVKIFNLPPVEGTSIEYKPFEQTKGRVTMRMKQYEQMEDDDIF